MSIRLEETETEYLLYVPIAHKERAKAINGRKWDPERRCWVYAKTSAVFNALIAEFGRELKINTHPREDLNSSTVERRRYNFETLQQDNQKLKEELEKLRQTLDLVANETISNKKSEADNLKKVLAERESELSRLKDELSQTQKTLQDHLSIIEDYKREISSLKEMLKTNKSASEFKSKLKEIAKEATGGDEDFNNFIQKVELDKQFPIQLANRLEQKLKKVLNISGNQKPGLYDLLIQVEDSEKMSQESLDLAHTIRRQRNLFAHSPIHQKTTEARILLCLFASALLWTELPEDEDFEM